MTRYSLATKAMVSDASTNPPFIQKRGICFISIYLIRLDWISRTGLSSDFTNGLLVPFNSWQALRSSGIGIHYR